MAVAPPAWYAHLGDKRCQHPPAAKTTDLPPTSPFTSSQRDNDPFQASLTPQASVPALSHLVLCHRLLLGRPQAHIRGRGTGQLLRHWIVRQRLDRVIVGVLEDTLRLHSRTFSRTFLAELDTSMWMVRLNCHPCLFKGLPMLGLCSSLPHALAAVTLLVQMMTVLSAPPDANRLPLCE